MRTPSPAWPLPRMAGCSLPLATKKRSGFGTPRPAASYARFWAIKAPLRHLAFSPDGRILASAGQDASIKLWDPASGQELQTLRGHSHAVNQVAFAPDGKRLASAAADRTVKLWDPATGLEVLTLSRHGGNVVSVAFERRSPAHRLGKPG